MSTGESPSQREGSKFKKRKEGGNRIHPRGGRMDIYS